MNEVVVYFPMAFIKFPGRKVGYAKTRKWFKSVCHIWEMMFTVLLCGLLCIFPTLFPILLSQGRCAKAGLHTNHLDITKAASSQAPAGSRQLWAYTKVTVNVIVKLKVDVRLRLYPGWVPARAKSGPHIGWMFTHETVESDHSDIIKACS